MALKWLRDQFKHLKIVLWAVVAVFVLLVFVDWGAGRSGGRSPSDAAVQIGDRVVTEQEFVSELRMMNQRFAQIYGDRWNELREQVDLAGQTVAYFVGRELQLEEAEAAGLVVSERELQERILADPLFQGQDGGFVGSERYERIVRSYFQMTPRQFERRYAEDLLVAKLNAMLEHGVLVTDDEVSRSIRRQREEADFDAVFLRYEPFLDRVTLDEADLMAFFESHSDDFRRDERRVMRYLLVETSRLRRLLEVDEDQLRTYYEEHRDEFMEDEQANARHVLIRVAPGASEEVRADAELRAKSVAQMARSGADFAALAAKHSDDPGSKDKGGDLGWFGRGQMVREFEDAVFGAKPGEILGPVRSQFGYHIIKVEGFRPKRQRPFDEVREEVRFRYLEGRAAAEAEVRAAELARRLATAETPESQEEWQQIADQDEAVVLNVSPAFEADEPIAGTGGSTELTGEVFAAEVGDIGGPRAIPRGWMVWQLTEIQPEGIPPFEDVRAEVEQRLRRTRALDLVAEEAAELVARWREGGTAQELAKAYEGTPVEARDHRWGQPIGAIGSAIALDEAVFSAAQDELVGPVRVGERGVAVIRIIDLDLVDEETLANELEATRARLRADRAQQLLQSILNERRRDTVVTVNDELMARFAPTS